MSNLACNLTSIKESKLSSYCSITLANTSNLKKPVGLESLTNDFIFKIVISIFMFNLENYQKRILSEIMNLIITNF